jgi:hypothetical protein
MNGMTKTAIAVLALGTLALGGCGSSVAGTVSTKLYVPGYYDTATQTSIPPCWELVVSGPNGGSLCVSKETYDHIKIGTNLS